ncbi:MAG: hypothetical protein AAB316_09790 [Bacteroidota bacterium]
MIDVSQFLDRKNKFDKADIELVSNLSFKAFHLGMEVTNSNIEKRMLLLEQYIQFLNKLLRSELIQSNEQHVELVKVIVNLKAQLEVFEVLSGKVKLEDLQAAAERMGKKSQSAVREF